MLTTSDSIKQNVTNIFTKRKQPRHLKICLFFSFRLLLFKKNNKFIQKCMFQTRYKKTKQDK